MSTGNPEFRLEDVVPLMSRIAIALEKLANQAESKQKPDGPNVSKESMAMVYVATHGVTSTKQIADQFGVTPRTVRRWPQLRQLVDGMKLSQSAGEIRSGYQTTNGVEATDW